jgi:hypothetical protein
MIDPEAIRNYAREAVKYLPTNEPIDEIKDHLSFGLIEEVGELAAACRTGDRDDIREEIGDVLWYLVCIDHIVSRGRNIGTMPRGIVLPANTPVIHVVRALAKDTSNMLRDFTSRHVDAYLVASLGRSFSDLESLMACYRFSPKEIMDEHLAKQSRRYGDRQMHSIEEWKEKRMPR